jgi:DNA-binding NarL/FixJ family response regulator
MDASRVWVDDRHPIFRRGLAAYLAAEGFTIVGESAQLVPRPPASAFDILVFDADGFGLQQASALARQGTGRLVAMVASRVEHLIGDAVAAGVVAVLVRDDLTPASLVASMRAVAAGATALPAELVPAMLDRAARSGRSGPHALATRELEVLRLLSAGDDTRAIGESLGYSERTVKNIVHDLLMKMNCRNRVHVVAQATRLGII